MLKLRVLTSLFLIPFIIASIFFLPPYTFVTLALLVMLLAGWEWFQLAKLATWQKLTMLVLLGGCLLGALFVPIYAVITLGLVWWVIALLLLLLYPKHAAWGRHRAVIVMMAFLALIPCWVGLIILQGFSPAILLYCLLLIWAVDIGGYAVGKRWGTHKLAPKISPGKSYEGLWGGLSAAAIVTLVGIWLLNIEREEWLLFFLVSMIGALISVLGDLFESMIKRVSGVKDSGTLLPGHGGLLDRIDSMLTAIPFFALCFPYFFNA